MESASILALIAILGSVITALFKLLANNTRALEKMVHSMDKVATTNTRIADESKERNGHLAEITVASKNQVLDRIDGMVINKQTVHNQVVEHETVMDRKDENS